MARDWRFRPASFRGATFYVDQIGPSGGRRKALHEYPGSENWDVEDLGTKAKKVSGAAYFVSETADADYAALVLAMDQPGPGELILPFFPVSLASAESWEPRWSREQLNYVGVELSFVVENPAGAPVPLGLGERILATLLAGSPAIIGGAVTALFSSATGISYQRSDAATYLTDVASFIETVRADTTLPDTTSAPVMAAIAALAPTAALASDADPGAFVSAALVQLDAVAIEADPAQAAPVFSTAAALAVAFVPPTLGYRLDDTESAITIPAALAVAAAMQAIRLAATAPYTDRIAAIDARDAIQAIAVAVLPFIGALGEDVTNLFSDVWGQSVTYLSAVITDLAPIVLFQSNLSLPSTALAYRLYGDPTRAPEIVARNRVSTALFMPTIFEAAAR